LWDAEYRPIIFKQVTTREHQDYRFTRQAAAAKISSVFIVRELPRAKEQKKQIS